MAMRRATGTGPLMHLQLAYNGLCTALADLDRHVARNSVEAAVVTQTYEQLDQLRARLGKMAWPVPEAEGSAATAAGEG